MCIEATMDTKIGRSDEKTDHWNSEESSIYIEDEINGVDSLIPKPSATDDHSFNPIYFIGYYNDSDITTKFLHISLF